ncbi:helicase with metal-binding cysteine cluster, partial [Pseudomonas sp. HMWF031]
MLPSIISHQTEEAIRTFLSHSFEMSSPLFSRVDQYGQYTNAMEDFLNKKENLAKGPYISMSLPFRTSQLTRDYFKNLYLPFPPFQHQAKAYERLSAAEPKSTLVATGTG